MRFALRMLPLAALGLVAYLNTGNVKKHFDVIGKVQVAATGGGQLQAIAEAVAREFANEGTLPVANFPQFLRDNLRTRTGADKRDVAKDYWGTEYQLAVKNDGFEVQSAGPDQAWKTADDLNYFHSLKGLGEAGEVVAALARARAVAAPALAPATGVQPTTTRRPLLPLPRQSEEETKRKVLEFQMRRAAEGSPQAQYDMAIRYLEGDGVDKDPAKGRELLEQSAQGGHAAAVKKLQTFPAKPKP